MRGPFGSLIAQARRELFQKRFPHRFLPSTTTAPQVHVDCQSSAARADAGDYCNCLILLRLYANWHFAEAPTSLSRRKIAICSDSPVYLFGYWNKAHSGMNLPKIHDMKGAR
jgi:hypothetical protein